VKTRLDPLVIKLNVLCAFTLNRKWITNRMLVGTFKYKDCKRASIVKSIKHVLKPSTHCEKRHISSTNLIRSGYIILQIDLITQVHFGSADL
jgi:hypothetical protein